MDTRNIFLVDDEGNPMRSSISTVELMEAARASGNVEVMNLALNFEAVPGGRSKEDACDEAMLLTDRMENRISFSGRTDRVEEGLATMSDVEATFRYMDERVEAYREAQHEYFAA